jgi:hypothetical protein
MRLYEEFGLSVSDDTIYRALKKLGFSHVSAGIRLEAPHEQVPDRGALKSGLLIPLDVQSLGLTRSEMRDPPIDICRSDAKHRRRQQ